MSEVGSIKSGGCETAISESGVGGPDPAFIYRLPRFGADDV